MVNGCYKIHEDVHKRLLVYVGYVMLFEKRVMCREWSGCYDDVNICLWTNGSDMSQSAAESACQQQSSFLPRITNNNIQSKLAEFRSYAHDALGGSGFWIDVKRSNGGSFHWIDGSSLAGLLARVICFNIRLIYVIIIELVAGLFNTLQAFSATCRAQIRLCKLIGLLAIQLGVR